MKTNPVPAAEPVSLGEAEPEPQLDANKLQVYNGELFAGTWPFGKVLRYAGGDQWVDCGQLGIATDKHVPAALQNKLVTQINEAFVAGMHRGVLFAAAATLIGAIAVFRYLPAHGRDVDGIPAATSPEELVDEDPALEPA